MPALRGLPIIVAATILFLSGCGGSGKFPVEGRVVYEEKERNPLPPLLDSNFRRFESSGLEYAVTRDKTTWVIKVHKPRQ